MNNIFINLFIFISYIYFIIYFIFYLFFYLKKLQKIWVLADISKDGYLDRDEFCIAMRLCELANSGTALPETLPSTMFPPKRKI